ncbi:MAG: serine hydrolase [Bacteroidota bacterium]
MKYGFLLCILIILSCNKTDEISTDQQIWEYANPAQVQLNDDSLFDLNERLNNEFYGFIDGLIIIKDDRLVFENYYFGNSRNTRHSLKEASINFTLSALGIALADRSLTFSSRIADFLPEYKAIFEEDSRKESITIENLLLNNSGFAWNESITNSLSPENDLNLMKLEDDWIAFVLGKPLEALPGQRTAFNSASMILLAKVIENSTNMDFLDFLDQRLLRPLEIESLQIDQDPGGNYDAATGISVSLIDWTKLGYLWQQNGLWQNRILLDEDFVSEATSTVRIIDTRRELGYFWQRFGSVFQGTINTELSTSYYLAEENGIQLHIIPDDNMVVGIIADNPFTILCYSPDPLSNFCNPSISVLVDVLNSKPVGTNL